MTNKQVSAKIGMFGPFVQIGEVVEGSDEKPQFASLQKGQSILTRMFNLPTTSVKELNKMIADKYDSFLPMEQRPLV